jgi:hypothetical protein
MIVSDFLSGKQLESARELSRYARQHNFYVTVLDQSKDADPRIMISIFPEGKPSSIFERNNHAVWYFYINDPTKCFGMVFLPEVLRGDSSKEFKNFKRFMSYIQEKYKRHEKGQTVVGKIADEILKQASDKVLLKGNGYSVIRDKNLDPDMIRLRNDKTNKFQDTYLSELDEKLSEHLIEMGKYIGLVRNLQNDISKLQKLDKKFPVA